MQQKNRYSYHRMVQTIEVITLKKMVIKVSGTLKIS